MVKPPKPAVASPTKRPPKIPGNLRIALGLGIIVCVFQLLVAWQPSKQNDSTTSRTTVVYSDPAVRSLTVTVTKTSDKAHGDEVHAGDTLTYRLLTTNPTSGPIATTTTFDIDDIAQYANVTELDGATISGNVANWPSETIAAGETSEHTLAVRVHDLPSVQAQGVTNPNSYDVTLAGLYGTAVSSKLEAPFVKRVELSVRELPVIPFVLSIILTLLLIILSVELLHQAKQGRSLSRLPGTLLIGWFAGSLVVLSICWLAGARSGFALSGSESLVGGVLGLLTASLIYLIAKAFGPRS